MRQLFIQAFSKNFKLTVIMKSSVQPPGFCCEKQKLISKLDELRTTFLKLSYPDESKASAGRESEDSSSKCETSVDSSKCNYVHDTKPVSTNRGLVGVTQQKNEAKTEKQRQRARKKIQKKTAKVKSLKSIIPPF